MKKPVANGQLLSLITVDLWWLETLSIFRQQKSRTMVDADVYKGLPS